MSYILSTQLYKGGADGRGPPREGRDLLTRFGTFSEELVVRRKHIDVREGSSLVYADHQHFAIVLFFALFLQRRRHHLVTLILTCVPHTLRKAAETPKDPVCHQRK